MCNSKAVAIKLNAVCVDRGLSASVVWINSATCFAQRLQTGSGTR